MVHTTGAPGRADMLNMENWTSWLAGDALRRLEAALAEWLPRQRWFGAKARAISSVRVLRWAEVPLELDGAADLDREPLCDLSAVLLHAEVSYSGGDRDVYQVPVALSTGGDAEKLASEAVIARLEATRGVAVLHDAIASDDVRQALLGLIARNATLPLHFAETAELEAGRIEAHAAAGFAVEALQTSRVSTNEQSNTSIVYGYRLILKLFRRLEAGENPDVEMGRFLSTTAKFSHIAPLLGTLTMTAADGESGTLAMLQGFVPNEGDGWSWFLAQTGDFFAAADVAPTETFDAWPEAMRAAARPGLEAAALLGQRTAELHLALSVPTEDASFSAEPVTCAHLKEDACRIEAQFAVACDLLQAKLDGLDETSCHAAMQLLARRHALLERIYVIAAMPTAGQRIRIHGDYHLGQTLRTREDGGGDFIFIDFEGEPVRSLAERRSKQSPLKDVAGMVRSFAYAAFAGRDEFLKTRSACSADANCLEAWAAQWEEAATAEFLTRYWQTMAANPTLLPPPAQAESLLRALVLEKALYELVYELNHRPAWLHIPLNGILRL